ncbi:MAG: hypothetical protein Q9221_007390 [Calogaya cf. arnoldii]
MSPPPTFFPSYLNLNFTLQRILRNATALAVQNPSIPTVKFYKTQLDNLSDMLERRTKELSSSTKDKSIRATDGEHVLAMEEIFLEQSIILLHRRMAATNLAYHREKEEGEAMDWKDVLERLRQELESEREGRRSLRGKKEDVLAVEQN